MTLRDHVAREYTFLKSITRTYYRMRHVKPDGRYTISDIVEEFARTRPDNVAVVTENRTYTYRELDEGANRYARWAMKQGVKRGDVVALLMSGRPQYLMAWLGIVKLGGIVALLNTTLRGQALAHCIAIAEARHIILGSELYDVYRCALPFLEAHPIPWVTGGFVTGTEDLDEALRECERTPIDVAVRDGLTAKDTAFYIYTSGTTGLPKAANFSHMRMLFMMFGFAGALDADENDRMYNPLPLYHSTGGVCAVGVALTTGGSVVIRPKFSTQEFWKDCHKFRPTYFQYIGELCRYLLNAPPSPLDRGHGIQAITGNGLRPDIWQVFQQRFEIPKIIEFYGATEGNVGMINYDGQVGAVGRIPNYMRAIAGTRVVKFDVENELPMRDGNGFCIECADDEVGEAIGKIRRMPGRNFEGYTHETDTRKKVLRNVFVTGDAWFRTGDLMRRDKFGYYYFVDRIGDTFRWKGENVATSEVAEALGRVPGIREANVYGVFVPHCDGRAGMASLVVDSAFDPALLAKWLSGDLPPYAIPVFLRLQSEMEVTGTFKQRKVELVKDAFDPAIIDDPLYWLDSLSGCYVPLDATRYTDIVQGRVRL